MKTLMVFLGTALVVFALTGCSGARPLHRTHASIRASLLKRTPPGTPKADVQKYVARHKWDVKTNHVDYLLGCSFKQGGGPAIPENVRSVIMAEFGSYVIFIGNCSVYGLWAFDDRERLIGIWIYKENDTP